MTNEPFAVTPDNRDKPLNVMGDKIDVLARFAQTGSYAISIVHGHQGHGPPPHKHDWNESFFVLNGEVEFTVGGTTQIAVPGTLVHFPAGTVHGFQTITETSDILEITGAGTRAVEMFSEIDREVPDNDDNAVQKTAEVLERNGVTIMI